MTGVKAVIFDIGNVLVEWHPEAAFDRAIGIARRKALFANVDLDTMNVRVDMGEEIADVVRETADRHPDYHDDILLWHTNWLDMFRPPIKGAIMLLRAIRAKGMPVFALSNFGTSTFDLAVSHCPVLDEFDRRYISGHLRMMKPDPAIYAHVEADCGLAPSALLFTDDKRENIEAAAARGWKTHLFEGPQGLANRLFAMGILHPSDIPA